MRVYFINLMKNLLLLITFNFLVVNDEKVSDGDKGCERAHKFVNCMIKQKVSTLA